MLRQTKTIFDGLGACLPDKRVSTTEIVDGCRNTIRLPLERLTGIRERRIAGDDLFSIDLAEGAIRRCLDTSGFAPADYDVLVCTNISRRDEPNSFTYEPGAATTLKARLGFDNALSIDLTNACAGMWTGVYLVDAMIRSGDARRGVVVSGEYISYLIDTAQLEITDFMDPQIASLTVGDAGVAVSMGLSPSSSVGLHDLELYTLSKYSPHCVAKPSSESHGGCVMYTDAIKVTEAVVPHAARHAKVVIDRNGWTFNQLDHVVPHQTSQLTMADAKREILRLYDHDLGDAIINNLPERGNTSSNSHFLALADAIDQGRLSAGDDIAFCISGSGQTTGTALYTLDDLPARVAGRNGHSGAIAEPVDMTLPVTLEVESVALVEPPAGQADTLTMLTDAAEQCLAKSSYPREAIDLLVSVGTHRTEFVMEPAIAALVGGRLKMNDDQAPDAEQKTFAFDLLNGPVGFLKACYIAGELARVGQLEQAMILAGEVENNRGVAEDQLLGLCEMGAAVVLRESPSGASGFEAFGFYDYLEHLGAYRSAANWNDRGQCFLHVERDANLNRLFLDCVVDAAGRFLDEQGVGRDEIELLAPPQIGRDFVTATADALGFSAQQTIGVADDDRDYASASAPASIAAARDSGVTPGSVALVLSVGAGVQVGCALYRF